MKRSSHAAIGITAPVLLTVLRVLQGVGVGGEWGGSVLLSMEWGSQRRRGFAASWPQVGVPVGLLPSTGMIKLMSGVSGSGFDTWGWRVPFLASIVLVAIAVGKAPSKFDEAVEHGMITEGQPEAAEA